MPGVGEAIDAAALTTEGAETAATLTEATEGASAAVNPASVGDASAAADANAATEGVEIKRFSSHSSMDSFLIFSETGKVAANKAVAELNARWPTQRAARFISTRNLQISLRFNVPVGR